MYKIAKQIKRLMTQMDSKELDKLIIMFGKIMTMLV